MGGDGSDSEERGTASTRDDRCYAGSSLGRGYTYRNERRGPSIKNRIDEYKIASAEARYRDQMLFTSFYLSLVALAVLLRVVIGLYNQQQFVAALIVSLVAAIGFASVLWWAYATKHARNRAWGRRMEIEEELPVFELNEYIAKDGKYDFYNQKIRDSKTVIGKSSSDFIIVFAMVTTLGWVGITGSTAVVLISGESTGAGLLVLAAVITVVTVSMIFYLLNHALMSPKSAREQDSPEDG